MAEEEMVVSGIGDLGTVLQQTGERTVAGIIEAVPNIAIALLIIIVGWIVAVIVSGILRRILDFIKFEKFLATHRIEDSLGKVKLTDVLVQLVKYYVILVFLGVALSLFQLGTLSLFLGQVVLFGPTVIGAVALVIAAAIVGEFVKEKVFEVHEKELYMRTIGNGAKYLLIFMGLIMGLATVGFDTTIITQTFVTLIQALGLAFGLGIGLAFGLGGQTAAKDWIAEARKKFHV